MAKRRENDSSLELLLDTMCNTFGGVMFIAITLAVIVAGRDIISKSKNENPPQEDIQALKKQIVELEEQLAKQAENTA